MKSERRQELKTNDLSVYLRQVVEYFEQHATRVIVITALGISAVIVIIALGISAVIVIIAFRISCRHRTPARFSAVERIWRSAAWYRPPTAAEAPNVDARRLPEFDWNALCRISCSASYDQPVVVVAWPTGSNRCLSAFTRSR